MSETGFLYCKNLNFGYDQSKNVLTDISFSLEKGQTLAIVGASGCGKSTLLRIISGILPSANSNRLSGQVSIGGLTSDEYRKSGKLAFMFQEPTLMPNLTVRENIALPLKIKGIKENGKVDSLLQTVGLTEHAGYLPKKLSGGMKTRVALARSFTTEPELLLLDEPFSALDIAWKSKLYMELEKLKEQFNTTVVMVTHNVQEGVMLANRVITFQFNGKTKSDEIVKTKIPIMKRIDQGHKFLENPDFSYMLASVQAMVMIDGLRNNTTREEAKEIINRIVKNANDGIETWDTLERDVICIRNHSNTKENHDKLFQSFTTSKTFFLRYQLMWDVVNYDLISHERIDTVYQFYSSNLKEASNEAMSYYQRTKENLLDYLIGSRITTDYPETKRWIYLCDMYASSEKEKVIDYLMKVENGETHLLNYDFARKVARELKQRIENENK